MKEWKNKGLFAKTFYSLNGLRSAFANEKAVRQEAFGTAAATLLAIAMRRGCGSVFLVFLASLFPMAIELINTAVEEFVDAHFGPAYREEVRAIKDTLSAAVLLALIIGYGICLKIIFF
ncbi:MAG: diacylglycerol kinase [Synergistes jonesii]|uniref:diacylglycerol kinase n=1 Tax=Synergistes jonesii TaxID=2754 RepID=UPI002A765CC3|nr:diacylglycerol kinase [Synergistes jonesii]MDY2985829.1 diacylglycerol kinase [Synergistes jonesii]